MDYTPVFKELLNELLDNQYMVLVAGRPMFTSKFEKELGYIPPITIPSIMGTDVVSPEMVLTMATANSAEAMKKIGDLKLLWNAFIVDASVPWRVKSDSGNTYTVRQYSQNIARKLQKIIQDPKIDYWRLAESTKNYYKTVTYKHLLSNYIGKDIWYHEYQSYNKDGKNSIDDGSNRWED